jgi:hypothetical protein
MVDGLWCRFANPAPDLKHVIRDPTCFWRGDEDDHKDEEEDEEDDARRWQKRMRTLKRMQMKGSRKRRRNDEDEERDARNEPRERKNVPKNVPGRRCPEQWNSCKIPPFLKDSLAIHSCFDLIT